MGVRVLQHEVPAEQWVLPFRILAMAAAASGLGYYYETQWDIAPAIAIGAGAYALYVTIVVLLMLPRLTQRPLVYAMALIDAGAIGAVLYMSRGMDTPFPALMPLVVAYYAIMYGLGPGLAVAVILTAGFVIMYVRLDMGIPTHLAVATYIPVLFVLALLGGYVRLRWKGRGALPLSELEISAARLAEVTVGGPSAPPAEPTVSPGELQPQLGQLTVGNIRIDGPRGRVFIGSHAVSLSPTQVELLYLLAQYAETPVAHETIRQRVWGESYRGQGNVVDVTVHRLRRKLERQGYPGYIRTIRGRGYLLNAAAG